MYLGYIVFLSSAIGALASAAIWLIWRRDRRQEFARDISWWFATSLFVGPAYSLFNQTAWAPHWMGLVGLALAYALAQTFLIAGVRRFALARVPSGVVFARLCIVLFAVYVAMLCTPYPVQLVGAVAALVAGCSGGFLLVRLWREGLLERLIGALIIFGTSINLWVAVGGETLIALALAASCLVRAALAFLFVFAALNRSSLAAAQMLQRFEQLSENALQGIMVLDAQRFYYVNPAAVQIYGYESARAMLQAGPFATATPAMRQEALSNIQRVLDGGSRINQTEGFRLRRDGTPVYLRLSGWPVEWEGHPAVQLLVTNETAAHADAQALVAAEAQRRAREASHQDALRDANAGLELRVQERTQDLARSNTHLGDANVRMEQALETLRSTQAELVQRERLASLGRMVAGMAHELNTPIGNALTVGSTLRHQVQQLRADVASGSIRRAVLGEFLNICDEGSEVLQSALHKAHTLVTNFRQLAQDHSEEVRRDFDLAEWLATHVALLQRQSTRPQITLVCEAAGEVRIQAYPEHLRMVLDQLIRNAQLHAFAPDSDGRIQVQLHSTPDSVCIAVVDNGRGVASAIQDKVFDPFFTTRMGDNVGMGLNLVYTTVTGRLGGSITLKDEAPHGARFEVLLPRSPV